MGDADFILDKVSEEEFDKAGSKFITFPPDAKVGDMQFRAVTLDMPDWDTPGQSIKFPVKVTEEGPDLNKEDKISCGVQSTGIWKLKQVLGNIDVEVKMVTGADKKKHPSFDRMALVGKSATGVWQMQKDSRSAEEGGKGTLYSKLIDLQPAGYRPEVEEAV